MFKPDIGISLLFHFENKICAVVDRGSKRQAVYLSDREITYKPLLYSHELSNPVKNLID